MNLKQLREIGKKATEGPWYIIDKPAPSRADHGWRSVAGAGTSEKIIAVKRDQINLKHGRYVPEMEFIAAARNHWDALLDVAEAADRAVNNKILTSENLKKVTLALSRLKEER